MPSKSETGVSISQKESAPFIKENVVMTDKKKNGNKQEPSTFEENVKAAYGTKPRDPKTIGSNIKLKGGKEPTETEKLTLVSCYRSPSMSLHSLSNTTSLLFPNLQRHSFPPPYPHSIPIFSS